MVYTYEGGDGNHIVFLWFPSQLLRRFSMRITMIAKIRQSIKSFCCC